MILFVIDIDWTVCCYILPYNFSLGGRGVIAWIGRGYRRENFRSGFMQIGFCQNVWAELRNIMLSIVQFSKGEKRKQLWFLAKNNSISKCQWLFDGHCLSLPHIFYTMVHILHNFLSIVQASGAMSYFITLEFIRAHISLFPLLSVIENRLNFASNVFAPKHACSHWTLSLRLFWK